MNFSSLFTPASQKIFEKIHVLRMVAEGDLKKDRKYNDRG